MYTSEPDAPTEAAALEQTGAAGSPPAVRRLTDFEVFDSQGSLKGLELHEFSALHVAVSSSHDTAPPNIIFCWWLKK